MPLQAYAQTSESSPSNNNVTPSEEKVESATSELKTSATSEEENTQIFGRYRIHIGAWQPKFSMPHYQEHYGQSNLAPYLAVDRFFFDWYATLGLHMSLAMYLDSGHAFIRSSENQFIKDENSKTNLTLIPVQVATIFEATPFNQKWLVVSGWFGGEYMYFQEVRPLSSSSEDNSEGNSEKPYINSGSQYGTVLGAAIHIKLNAFDERSANSLETLNMRSVYLTPYFELVKSLKNSDFNFSRSTIGIGFTFETLY